MDILSNGKILGNIGTHLGEGATERYIILTAEINVNGEQKFQLINWRRATNDSVGNPIPAGFIAWDRDMAHNEIAAGRLVLMPGVIDKIYQHVSHQYDIPGQYRNIWPQFVPNSSGLMGKLDKLIIPVSQSQPEYLTLLGDGISKAYVLEQLGLNFSSAPGTGGATGTTGGNPTGGFISSLIGENGAVTEQEGNRQALFVILGLLVLTIILLMWKKVI